MSSEHTDLYEVGSFVEADPSNFSVGSQIGDNPFDIPQPLVRSRRGSLQDPSEQEHAEPVNNDFFPEEAPVYEPPAEEPHPANRKRGPCKTVWMFTVPNYTQKEVDVLQRMGKDECVYMCFGKEIAPTTGTPHLQGFCILKRKQYYTYFKTVVGRQMWPVFWRVRGSPEANKKVIDL